MPLCAFNFFAMFYRRSSRILQNSLIHVYTNSLTQATSVHKSASFLFRYLTQVCLLFTPIHNTLLRYLTQVCLLFTPIPNMLLRYLTQVCLLFTPLCNTLLHYLTQVCLLFTSLPNKVKLLGSGSRDENTVEPVD